MKKIIKKVFSVISVLFLVVLIAAVVYLVYIKITGGIPSFFGYSIFNVVSGSMEPTIPVGEYILVKDVDDGEALEPGDVISFYSRDEAIFGQPNTHRIVALTKTEEGVLYTTKGDANSSVDSSYVHQSDIIGKYVSSLPFLSSVGGFLKNPFFFFIIIVIPAGVLFVAEIINLLKQSKKIKEETEKRKKIDEYKQQLLSEENSGDAEEKLAIGETTDEDEPKELADVFDEEVSTENSAEEDKISSSDKLSENSQEEIPSDIPEEKEK